MWKQCQEGVSGASCTTGGSSFLSWDAAQSAAGNSREAGYNDWRLPTLLELQSTVASSCASAPPLPLINGTAFPNTPTATVFWSATPNASSSTNALALWFKDGSTQTFDRGTGLYVRLVRGGQAFGMLAPAEQFPSFDLVRTVPLRYNGNTQLYGDTYGYSGNPAVFGVSFGQCTVVNANTGFLIAGFNAPAGSPCVVTLNQFGRVANGQNYAQATEVQLNITIGQAWQQLSFAAPPGVSVGGTGVVAATSDKNLTPITFTSMTPGVCTLSGSNGSTVTGVAVGLCTIRASQPGNGNYLPALADMSFGIGPGSGLGTQTLSFGAAPTINVGGTGAVSATSNQALSPVTLTSATLPVCTISSGTVLGVAAGTCTINASAPSAASYLAATASLSFGIGLGAQSLSFGAAPLVNVGGTGPVTVTSNLGLTPVLSTSTLPVCTISGNIVAGVASGLCTIHATQGGNANAASAVADLSFSVGVGAPTLTFGAAPFITVGGTGTVSVTSDRNATPVSLTSTTPTCTLASGVVTGVSSGLCTIQAAQSAASSYTAASANLSFSIGAAALICNLHMDGVNPMLASKEGLILARAMLGFTGTAVTQGTGITLPWETIRDALNAKCGTAFP